MNKFVVIGIIVIVIGLGVWWFMSAPTSQAPVTSGTPLVGEQAAVPPAPAVPAAETDQTGSILNSLNDLADPDAVDADLEAAAQEENQL